MKKTYIFITIIIFFIILAIVIQPKIYISAFSNGLNVWAKILLPTIFPLIFFTKLLTDLGITSSVANKFSFTQKLFKTPPISSYAFMVSILSGYPVGAKIVSDLYINGYVSRNEACKMCTFTSNSGPMFIYGSVGIGMLFSQKLAIIMLISHILGAICNGILYRNYNIKITTSNSPSFANKAKFSLSETMTDSILSILIIGGFIAIFFVIIEIFNQIHFFEPLSLFLSNLFGINSAVFNSVFNGILEMTHGCLDITSLNLPISITTIICCGMITFGGIATMLQAFAFLQKIGMTIGFFFLQKITHTIFACVICFIFLLLFGLL